MCLEIKRKFIFSWSVSVWLDSNTHDKVKTEAYELTVCSGMWCLFFFKLLLPIIAKTKKWLYFECFYLQTLEKKNATNQKIIDSRVGSSWSIWANISYKSFYINKLHIWAYFLQLFTDEYYQIPKVYTNHLEKVFSFFNNL